MDGEQLLTKWAEDNGILPQYTFMRDNHGFSTFKLVKSVTYNDIEFTLKNFKVGERRAVLFALENLPSYEADNTISKKRKLSIMEEDHVNLLATSKLVETVSQQNFSDYISENKNYMYAKNTKLPVQNTIIAFGNRRRTSLATDQPEAPCWWP